MESALWGLIGTVVGALASVGTTWLTTRTSHRLQIERTKDEREERLRTFQRETILGLQDALHEGLRQTTHAYIRDQEAHSKGQDWGKIMLPEEISDQIRS